MRAIAGYVGSEASGAQRRAMLRTARGGEEPGEFLWPGGGLLCSGKEGCLTLRDRGKCWSLVWDGELYNPEEIRRALSREGVDCSGENRTELLLRSWITWGPGCLDLLEGAFAFAVAEDHRLILARDAMGIRPLFYGIRRGELTFGSEIKNLLPRIPPVLDEDGLLQLIMLGPGRRPGSGVLRGILELEPGCYGIFENGTMAIHRYWSLRAGEHRDSFAQTADAVRAMVTEAVVSQMTPDMGTFLSGGLDSGILSALCAGELQKTGGRLRTYSVDYLNNDIYFQPGKFQPDSDERYIRLMSQALPSVHRRCVLTAEDLFTHLKPAVAARDLPGMADVDSSLLVFAGEVELPAVMSGECADELFGGYPWFRDPEIREQKGFPWAQNTRERASLLRGNPARAADFVMEAYERTCRETELPEDSPEASVRRMAHLNYRWFMQTLLDRNDRMSAAAGLKVQVPFCSRRLAQYLYNVPWEYKDYRGREKGLLRYAFRDLLPEPVLLRKKSPYPKTFDPGYEHLVMEALDGLMARESPLWELIGPEAVRNLLNREADVPWYGQLMRRPQTAAYLLQMDLWLKMYDVQLVNINL